MKYLTAGESHGKTLTGILEGLPAQLKIDIDFINGELKRRQTGYGRGGRQKIEKDTVDFTAGVRNLLTLGSPVGFTIRNADYENWQAIMSAEKNAYDEKSEAPEMKKVTAARPGHADLAGAVKYNTADARNILERASARNTASTVVLGAIAKLYLNEIGIEIDSYTVSIGKAHIDEDVSIDKVKNNDVDQNEVRCPQEKFIEAMKAEIDGAKAEGDTVGGKVRIHISGMPIGVGSVMKRESKLDAMLMSALGGMQAVKAVEVGYGTAFSDRRGGQVCDSMRIVNGQIKRNGNFAGGLEGGMTNGEDIVLTLTIKPIPTLYKGADTVDIATLKNTRSVIERSDVCAVVPAGIVAESLAALTVMQAIDECVGGDTMDEVRLRVDGLRSRYENFLQRG